MDVFVATNFALKVMSILFLLLAILTVYKGVVVVPTEPKNSLANFIDKAKNNIVLIEASTK